MKKLKNLELFAKYKIFHQIKNLNASKILYIDECPISCSVAKSTLANMGYIVDIENNIQTVFNKVEIFIPDIIMIDINSKNFNAIDILNLIKTKMGNRQTISIAVVNNYDKYDFFKTSFYFDFLISKPIEKKSFDFLTLGDKSSKQSSSLKKVEKRKHLNKIYYAYNKTLETHKELYKKSVERMLFDSDKNFKDWLNYIRDREFNL